MKIDVIVGGLYGDEGKGKIVSNLGYKFLEFDKTLEDASVSFEKILYLDFDKKTDEAAATMLVEVKSVISLCEEPEVVDLALKTEAYA